jgi:hypothetical protein
MTANRITLLAFALALPIHHAAGQARPPATAKMTPEERTAAQAKLNREAAQISSQPLDAPKQILRNAVIIMRDSLDAAVGTAALITRAQATRSSGVELSQSRRLRTQCAAAQRTTVTTLKSIATLSTPDPKGTKLLADYRTVLGEVGRLMGGCEKLLGTALASAKPASAGIASAVGQVNSAANRHTPALNDLMVAMEINLRQ